MIELIAHEKALPFAVALALMALLLVMEMITLAFGTALSSIVDGALPDLDTDVDVEMGSQLSVAAFLAWLKLDQLPALVVFIVFLACFGLLGLTLQSVIASQVGEPMRASMAAIITLPLTLPVMKPLLSGIAKVMPQDETEAVFRASFVGATAVITLGTASVGSPAQARLADAHGQTHYVMVEPLPGQPELPAGSTVIITESNGNGFFARSTS